MAHKVTVEFEEDMWDPTKQIQRETYPNGVYKVKGMTSDTFTSGEGNEIYKIAGEIVGVMDPATKGEIGKAIETILSLSFEGKPANVKKVKTACVSAGSAPDTLMGNKSFDLDKVFIGRTFYFLVRNPPEGTMVVAKNGKEYPANADIEFVTGEQAKAYYAQKRASHAVEQSTDDDTDEQEDEAPAPKPKAKNGKVHAKGKNGKAEAQVMDMVPAGEGGEDDIFADA